MKQNICNLCQCSSVYYYQNGKTIRFMVEKLSQLCARGLGAAIMVYKYSRDRFEQVASSSFLYTRMFD
jgi:hypothetical protein